MNLLQFVRHFQTHVAACCRDDPQFAPPESMLAAHLVRPKRLHQQSLHSTSANHRTHRTRLPPTVWPSAQAPPEIIIEAGLQSVVLQPFYEGLMSRLRRPHLHAEISFIELRQRLKDRKQSDFGIPAKLAVIGADGWAQPCAALARIGEFRTGAGQLACLINTAREIYSMVQGKQAAAGKAMSFGADEFTPCATATAALCLRLPMRFHGLSCFFVSQRYAFDDRRIFIWCVVRCGAVDLYSCRDFVMECAPPTMVAGEGGYYLTQLAASLHILEEVGAVYPWAPGPLPFLAGAACNGGGGGGGGESGGAAAADEEGTEDDLHIWSWADDSNAKAGKKQDIWVPYSLDFSQRLEQALAGGQASIVKFDDRRHVDLSRFVSFDPLKPWASPLTQVVTSQPHLMRRVKRETATVAKAHQIRQAAGAKDCATRAETEHARQKTEQLLHSDAELSAGTLVEMVTLNGKGETGIYCGFKRERFGANWHMYEPKSGVQKFRLTTCDCRVLPPADSAVESHILSCHDSRSFSSAYGSNGEDCRQGGLYSTRCWRAARDTEEQWYEINFGNGHLHEGHLHEVFGVCTKGRAGFGRHAGEEWVTSYKFSYTADVGDDTTMQRWLTVDADRVFVGNSNCDEVMETIFHTPVKARFVRVHPVSWHRHISMRVGGLSVPLAEAEADSLEERFMEKYGAWVQTTPEHNGEVVPAAAKMPAAQPVISPNAPATEPRAEPELELEPRTTPPTSATLAKLARTLSNGARAQSADANNYKTCLDRPFVQMEARMAQEAGVRADAALTQLFGSCVGLLLLYWWSERDGAVYLRPTC